ncbi:hypothetical protein NLJ89_g1930 [Agrocybe chaxingu]|uniref:Uncharacterized protein n=1 Tax=Agrocybe chaxingu TaxID=84603 RepID=A0A9W8MZ35_9AGAR|nr:hypothetical protein NLJ89_g1930 [Agrocybe chaxingu]
MRHILDPTAFNPRYYPKFMDDIHTHITPPLVPPTQRTRSLNQNTGSGYGLTMPTDPFDIPGRCQYVVAHQMISTSNAINGVIVDFAGRVYLPTMFAYLLAKLLGPVAKQAAKTWIPLFAYIAARPHLYAERVEQYNDAHVASPFVENAGPTYVIQPSGLTDSTYRNATEDDVVNDLIRNRIPVSWIDHAYAFGLRVLDQTISNFGRYQEVVRVDNERMERLRRYGMPPTLPSWSGWWSPSMDDTWRIRYLYFTNPTRYDLDNPFIVPFGGDPTPPTLISRMHEGIIAFTIPPWNSTGHEGIDATETPSKTATATRATRDQDTEMADATPMMPKETPAARAVASSTD